MAGNIKGIIVEIGGDTSGLQKALSNVNKITKSLSSELRGVNSLLKLDPKNTVLVNQKQELLNKSIQETNNKLKELQKAQKEYVNQGKDLNSENYRYLQREIESTKIKLKSLKEETQKFTLENSKLYKLGDSFKSIGNSITSVGKKMMGLTTTIVAGVTAGVRYNANIEKLHTNLKVLLGNETKATEMLNTLKEMAKTTPFETTNLVSATQTLLSFGVEANEVHGILKMLGDVSMGDKDKLGSLALVFGQISANGKLMGQDLLQLINAGFNPLNVISEKTGESMESLKDRMSKGEIGIEDVTEAFKIATSEGGLFYKGMEEGSKTTLGKFSTATDSLKESLGQLTESILPTVTKIVDKITELANSFNSLDEGTKQSILNFLLLLGGLAPILLILGKIIGFFGSISIAIAKITPMITKLITIVKPFITAIGTFLGTTLGSTVLIVGAIASVIAIFVVLWNKSEAFRNFWINLWENIKTAVANFVENIKQFFTVTIPELIKKAGEFIQSIPYRIGFLIGLILGKIIKFGIDLFNWVTTELPNLIVTILTFLWELPGKIWNVLLKVIEKMGNWISNMIQFVKENIPKVIENIFNFFNELPKKMLDIGKNIVEGLWNGIQNAKDWLFEKIGSFAKGILDGMKNALGIHSPSRLFRDEVGVNLAKGVGIGFMSGMKKVSAQMNNAIPTDFNLQTNGFGNLSNSAGGNVVNIYTQELDSNKLDQILIYVNNKFGMAY